MRSRLIVHIVHRLATGGAELGLLKVITGLPPESYRHAVISMTDCAPELQAQFESRGVRVLALGKRPGQDFPAYLRLWRLLRSLRPDIVHTRNIGTLDAQLWAALAGVKARVHGEHGRDMYDLEGKNRVHRFARRCLSPLIDRFVTVSRDLESWLIDAVGISADRVTQIYNGVDLRRFQPAEPVRPFGPPGFAGASCVVFGCVLRMQLVKDPLTLANAFLELLRRHPEARRSARLAMIGDGPLKCDCEALIERAGAAELCWLPGERQDVDQLMKSFDVFVLPSIGEGISNTILEAMATGLPVVATRVGGNPELVDPAVTGILVDPSDPQEMADALEQYFLNPALAPAHGRAGRKRAETCFGLERMIEGYSAVYGAVLGRHYAAGALANAQRAGGECKS